MQFAMCGAVHSCDQSYYTMCLYAQQHYMRAYVNTKGVKAAENEDAQLKIGIHGLLNQQIPKIIGKPTFISKICDQN